MTSILDLMKNPLVSGMMNNPGVIEVIKQILSGKFSYDDYLKHIIENSSIRNLIQNNFLNRPELSTMLKNSSMDVNLVNILDRHEKAIKSMETHVRQNPNELTDEMKKSIISDEIDEKSLNILVSIVNFLHKKGPNLAKMMQDPEVIKFATESAQKVASSPEKASTDPAMLMKIIQLLQKHQIV